MTDEAEDRPAGDEFDVAAFIRDNDGWLRRRVRNRLGARGGEIDDVLQTTYVKLWRAAPRIASVTHARRFCVVAAAHVACDNARGRTPIPVELDPGAAGLAPDPADVVVQRETGETISSAVASLTPDQRSAWVGYELHDLSYAAIGSRMSRSPSAVRGLLYRARVALQERMLAADKLVRDGLHALVIYVMAARASSPSRTQDTEPWVRALVGSVAMFAGTTVAGPLVKQVPPTVPGKPPAVTRVSTGQIPGVGVVATARLLTPPTLPDTFQAVDHEEPGRDPSGSLPPCDRTVCHSRVPDLRPPVLVIPTAVPTPPDTAPMW